MADDNVIQRAFKRLRPGSGNNPEAVSIIDTKGNRAPNPGRRRDLSDMGTDDSNWPVAGSTATIRGEQPAPAGVLAGVLRCDCKDGNCVNSKHGVIPKYEPDNAQVLNRLFGLAIPEDD